MQDSKLGVIGTTVVLVVTLYLAVSAIAWSINNPVANSMTYWIYFNDAIHFRTLPEFQPK